MGKRAAKKKAKSALPTVDRETKKPNRPAILAGVAALGGVLMFWRRKSSGSDGPPPAE